MKDAIGNKIVEGNLLHWQIPTNLRAVVARVAQVTDGGLSIVGAGRDVTPPMLTIVIHMPLDGSQPGREPVLLDFVRIVDPQSDGLLDKLSGAATQ